MVGTFLFVFFVFAAIFLVVWVLMAGGFFSEADDVIAEMRDAKVGHC